MVKSYRPETLKEALELRRSEKMIPLAGGTDLMVKFRNWAGLPPLFEKSVLMLNNISDLSGIYSEGKNIIIEAGVTLTETAESECVPAPLRKAAAQIAAPGIRNRATLAGNICNASPAGDTLVPLYVLGAKVRLENIHGRRELLISEYIRGPGKTVLKDDELLTAVIVPPDTSNISFYKKVGTRKANALTKVSFLGLAEIKEGILNRINLAFGAVGPVIVRSKEIEAKLIGLKSGEIDIDKVSAEFSALIIPIDDQRSTAKYRKKVALNLLGRFLTRVKEL